MRSLSLQWLLWLLLSDYCQGFHISERRRIFYRLLAVESDACTPTVKESIESKLIQIKPTAMFVSDVSSAHKNHREVDGIKGETHFNVYIESESFIGLSLVSRHRLIYSLLDYELKNGVHALSIEALTPVEAASRIHMNV